MYDQTHKLFYLHENQYITSTDYLQTVVLIEAGSMETYHLNLNYNIIKECYKMKHMVLQIN